METVGLKLLALGFTIAASAVGGFVIFINNRKSITGQTFFLFSLITSFWGAVNFLNSEILNPAVAFWLIRFTIFSGVWHSFFLFQLVYVFPEEKPIFPKRYKFALIPLVTATSCLTLTPLVFNRVGRVSPQGIIEEIVNGPGIIWFALVVLGLVASSIILLAVKAKRATGQEKVQYLYILVGVLVTFLLLMTFNFILPAFFDDARFIPLGPVFIFPLIAATWLAIRRGLLHTKVLATEGLTLLISFGMATEVIMAKSWFEIVFRSLAFAFVLAGGLFLIQSVRREVEQKEKLQSLSDELSVANQKLTQLSQFKTQLLSLASHQIRSPMAAIKGYIEITLQGLYGPVDGKIKDVLRKMEHSTNNLLGLINTLLDLRKVEEGKMEYRFERTNLCDIVNATIEDLRSLATEKQLELSAAVPERAVWVNADPQKLTQVIQNFVDNAIKYTPKGFVKVELTAEQGMVEVSVSDSGLGIPADLVPHLFEEFVRDERIKHEILGTGFGLYIAKRIIEAHGGTLRAKSEGRDKGSRFTMRLACVE